MASISGLVSGLDSAAIVNAMMNVERLPQQQLMGTRSDLTRLVTALQSLNAKTASLGEAAGKAANQTSWDALSAKSSSDAVTASVRANGSPTSVTFNVDRVAQSQISLSGSFSSVADLTGGASTLSLKTGDTVTQIDVSGITSPADLAAAISRSDAGVAASVTSSTDSFGNQTFRLQLTGTQTGADQSFTLYAGDADAVQAGTATQLSLVEARAAQDAQVTLWAGTPAAQTVTSASNTFTDLLTGLDVTVVRASADPVTVDVARDTDALTRLGSDLVSQLNQVLSEISSQTAVTSSTDARGNPTVSAGVLAGNSVVRSLSQDLMQAGSRDINGVSPSDVGIVFNKDGTFTFDAEKFAAALADDPARVQAVVSGIAERVNQVATTASDRHDGTLTQRINSDNDRIRDLSDRIAGWDNVLELRRTTLERQWAALETALSRLQSQSSWLTSMSATLDGLKASSRS
ncbi:MAG: flagellar filament capping protein FliD [Micrococcales bacterium]|nr:flagellar filament capping protein FliD [Micrococcales bacterium]